MPAIQQYNTRDVTAERRLTYWNDLAGVQFAGSTVDGFAPDFQGHMWSWSMGNLQMLRPRTQPCRINRRPMAQAGDKIILHMQHRGSGCYRQRGRQVELSAGDLVLCSSAEAYSIDLSQHETLAVEFPRAKLDCRIANLDDHLARLIDGRLPGVRLLHDFLLSLWQQGNAGAQSDVIADEFADIFYSMIAMAVRNQQHALPFAPKANTLDLIRTIVEARLSDPDFGSASLAEESGHSIRTLQKLLATQGITPSGYIQSMRLTRASEKMMSDPDRSITEIAFDHGFNDSSYFSRCFRQHFGISPREWRHSN